MNEFSLITEYFQKKHQREEVLKGIGDDAAILRIPDDQDLLVSTDTLVSGLHFLEEWPADCIAQRVFQVNASDIIAMGGTPKWATLAITLPDIDYAWLSLFSSGLQAVCDETGIALVGGDTTRGPLSITLTIHGTVPRGASVRRDTAKAGDAICLTGTLGLAALAVEMLDATDLGCSEQRHEAMSALMYPKARFDWGELIRQYASACIDISDGLSADLGHICKQSQVDAILFDNHVPIESSIAALKAKDALEFTLSAGDAYELCFTVPAERQKAFRGAAQAARLPFYTIGTIESGKGLIWLENDQSRRVLHDRAFKHFYET